MPARCSHRADAAIRRPSLRLGRTTCIIVLALATGHCGPKPVPVLPVPDAAAQDAGDVVEQADGAAKDGPSPDSVALEDAAADVVAGDAAAPGDADAKTVEADGVADGTPPIDTIGPKDAGGPKDVQDVGNTGGGFDCGAPVPLPEYPTAIDTWPTDCTGVADGADCMPPCNSHGTCKAGKCVADGKAIKTWKVNLGIRAQARLAIVRDKAGNFVVATKSVSPTSIGAPLPEENFFKVSPAGAVLWAKVIPGASPALPHGMTPEVDAAEASRFGHFVMEAWTPDGTSYMRVSLAGDVCAVTTLPHGAAALKKGYLVKVVDSTAVTLKLHDAFGALQWSSKLPEAPGDCKSAYGVAGVDRPGGGVYVTTCYNSQVFSVPHLMHALSVTGKLEWTLPQAKPYAASTDGVLVHYDPADKTERFLARVSKLGAVLDVSKQIPLLMDVIPFGFAPDSRYIVQSEKGVEFGIQTPTFESLWKVTLATSDVADKAPQSVLRLEDGGFVLAYHDTALAEPLIPGDKPKGLYAMTVLVRTDARGGVACQ